MNRRVKFIKEKKMLKKKCIGCGVELQFEDKTKEGYVPEEKICY